MAKVQRGRRLASLEPGDEAVLFVIGMRINRLSMFWKWIPVFQSMPRMIIELMKNPDLGLLARPRTYVSGRVVLVVQYWKSFELLEAYARANDHLHLPAWRSFNRRIRDNGSVGIFHETYRVRTDDIETVYANMPAFGLGEVYGVRPLGGGGQSAAARLGVRPDGDLPVEPY